MMLDDARPCGAMLRIDREVTRAREHRPLSRGSSDGPQPYQGRPSVGPVPLARCGPAISSPAASHIVFGVSARSGSGSAAGEAVQSLGAAWSSRRRFRPRAGAGPLGRAAGSNDTDGSVHRLGDESRRSRKSPQMQRLSPDRSRSEGTRSPDWAWGSVLPSAAAIEGAGGRPHGVGAVEPAARLADRLD
jgi:hypothetical protein